VGVGVADLLAFASRAAVTPEEQTPAPTANSATKISVNLPFKTIPTLYFNESLIAR